MEEQVVPNGLLIEEVVPGLYSVPRKPTEDQIVGIYIDIEKGKMWTYSRTPSGVESEFSSDIPEKIGFYGVQREKSDDIRYSLCAYIYEPGPNHGSV